jgi:hypothetical protein
MKRQSETLDGVEPDRIETFADAQESDSCRPDFY